MSKILVFGDNTVHGVPENVRQWLIEYTKQGHEFIVGDKRGFDQSLHMVLSSVGAADASTIYCINEPNSNEYGFKCKKFIVSYDEDSKVASMEPEDKSCEPCQVENAEPTYLKDHADSWNKYRNRQMARDCDAAICIVGKENKTTVHLIQLLNILNKPCYCVDVVS